MSPSSFVVPESYASVEDYAAARKALIAAERNLGYEGRAQRTALEAEAEAIVLKLKAWEEHNHHGVNSDGSGHEAGHRFMHGLESVTGSKLLAIASKAPKGCLLHCHYDAMIPPETILSDARQQPLLHISTDIPLTNTQFFAHAFPQFDVFAEDAGPSAAGDIFSPSYVSGSWMKYSEFLARFPGGPERAEAWIRKTMVLQIDDVYHPKQTVNGIWKHFNRAMRLFRSMLCYETAFREHFRRMLWKFAEDGISYAEVRFGLDMGFTVKSDDGRHAYSVPEIVKLLWQTNQEETPKIQASGLAWYGAKIIYACMRTGPREAMLWAMDTAIQVKQAYPDFVCAFDMHGQEDAGQPHKFWIPELLAMREKINALNLDLPFNFHAGETHDHGGETDSNLFDVILLGTKRIGHGFSITKHPLLMQLCKEKNIAIETCPISNEVLGLCPTTKSHHLPVLLSNCVPCTVSSDDPGAWDANVLSHDFYQAIMGSNNMSLLGWRVLAEWSLEHSYMDAKTKAAATENFQQRWTQFCQWIVDEYGS
ncbi:Metallo-dependent hydrolase [Thozetella sp. PMI_491]|nr:Metallo-dependent hydrolase [Thozetella sp. PMI_491]